MNFAHLHLLLNHFPVIGTMIGAALYIVSFLGKNKDLKRVSFIIFAFIALLAIPTYMSGVGAQLKMTGEPGISNSLIQRHLGAAMLSLLFMEITGALSLVALWKSGQSSGLPRWNVVLVLIFSLLTVALMARTGNTGGDIRHSEVRTSQDGTVTEGTVGSIFHAFEPSPAKVSLAMIFSKWCTAILMDLHFMGLIILIGSVGVLDLRIMGFGRQMPIAPLHRFVPWALFGFGINVVTGTLAYIGMPDSYTLDIALWLKMLALLLLGLNAAAFYLTDIFEGVEHLGAGEDAPWSAKLVAGSSLFLWFSVIILGRYIQLLGGTLPGL